MMMMMMRKKLKRSSSKEKLESYRVNSGKLNEQQKKLDTKKNEKRQNGSVKEYRVEYS